ncbi:P-loop containing nucleoside triphosphate hydrolase protein [Hypoxylon fuscum]|nr:P-loop containing nucleoside triphosphate hydrolase protein [Hypoxylon fuscum]
MADFASRITAPEGLVIPPNEDTMLQENSYDVEVQLSNLHQDTDNPLGSVSSFEELGLPVEILKGLTALNFQKPSKVQEKALPLMLANPPTNMIAQSQSGTGKTAAFVTTVLTRVDHSRPAQRQFDVSQLRVLVIDEADNMLDQQGMGDQCTRLKNSLPKNIQILLFSATFPDKVMKYANSFAPHANQIKLQVQELTVKGISQMYMDCPSESDKYDILCKLYGLMNIGSSIIFVKTRESANQIQKRMTEDGHKVSVLHGAYEGSARDSLLEEFRTGRSKVLITTNVLARGIDVSTVSMVINYDIPMKGMGDKMHDTETYLHRIGRTGRFGRVGVSITFISDKKSFDALNAIAQDLEIDLVALKPDDWDETESQVQNVIKSSRAQAGYVPGGQVTPTTTTTTTT